MNLDFCITYIGYLVGYHFKDPVLLCVSNNRDIVKYYLKKVRKLTKDQYEIREVALDNNAAMYMYEDYILEEYFDAKYKYLTNRDIQAINENVHHTIDYMEKTYDQYSAAVNLIIKGSSFNPKKNTKKKNECLLSSLEIFKEELSSVKGIRNFCNADLRNSPIFSDNILEYLRFMGYLQEDKEMTELFYRKVFDEYE